MNCLSLAGITTICFFLCTSSTASTATTPLGMVQTYENTVITIQAQNISLNGSIASMSEKIGAGVVIDPNGFITTNTHVIYGSNIIKVILNNNVTVNAEVLFISREYDFSILKINPPFPLKAIEWAHPVQIELGQEIITIGHSPLLNHTISGGQINGLGTRKLDDGSETPELLKISINHYPGDSGGPVFNTNGQLIGLMNSKQSGIQRAVFAIPASKIYLEYLNLVNTQQTQ